MQQQQSREAYVPQRIAQHDRSYFQCQVADRSLEFRKTPPQAFRIPSTHHASLRLSPSHKPKSLAKLIAQDTSVLCLLEPDLPFPSPTDRSLW
ncbi:hypothetical protein Mp_1g06590 [Marchantia polymorpha subsp. ruderalis]|uniref:Uncharacterized protein n=2 Tax=Marchantia polymorpha TaxID=3197 RepID=A0AAF6AM92_MARPO|nr:hypothetical protein MARPO_0043s0051 [Marchantia polymorpha]BBM97562.1 hypothetical protein Mp_1g06590 [Marchantia polymorpha subsp. ruderalis]|eukprot:PTQ39803.1 hypothetical protein MARPO_0043s0051 [Marchantia polymorpha]